MNCAFIKRLICFLLITFTFNVLCFGVSYANTYSNNSIEIDVSPQRRSYDYGDNVSLDISITNKNRYGKLHYKIIDIYSGGGFIPINNYANEGVVDVFSSGSLEVNLKDFFYKEKTERDIDTHITFNNGYTSPNNSQVAGSKINKNNGYYQKKHTYTIGGHAYELTEAEYDEYKRYRNEKVLGEKIGTSPNERSEQEQLEAVKGQINATFLIIIIVVIVIIFLIVFIWFIIKSKSRSGYHGLSSFLVFCLLSTLILNYKIYAADIYQENTKYNKSISTQVSYANFTCTFDVKVEYYFVNTIAPITNLELDTDFDTLPDYLEVLYLTDLNNEDTDGDGLPDGVEVYRTYTDPLRVDTDNNGVNDSDEDYDKDKLTNIEEKNHGTDYDNVDTDYDNLLDYDEINGVKSKDGLHTYITDPLSEDTDGDGLRDDTEIKLGLDPTKMRTDGSIIDSEREIYQEMGKDKLPNEINDMSIPVSFYGSVKGLMEENVNVTLSKNSFYNKIRGKVGEAIIIDTTYGGDSGLKAKFDISKYMNVKNDIQVCRYEDGELKPVDHTFVNGTNLLSDVYSGEYVLIDTDILLQGVNIYK